MKKSNYDIWKPILDMFDVDDDKKIKMADYADHHAKLEVESNSTVSIDFNNSLLPMSLKILSKIDDFEVTYDASEVKDHTISVTLSKDDLLFIKESIGIDVIPYIENMLMEEIIHQCKDKKILVYTMVDSIQSIAEVLKNSKDILLPKIIIKSRIKILEK